MRPGTPRSAATPAAAASGAMPSAVVAATACRALATLKSPGRRVRTASEPVGITAVKVDPSWRTTTEAALTSAAMGPGGDTRTNDVAVDPASTRPQASSTLITDKAVSSGANSFALAAK